jgi:hypothetical protein
MLETQKDYWGGGDYWPQNPYNSAVGGPCTNQNAFFTDPTARRIYKKRLRYLVARYGAYPSLLAWQFFNEIDNVYRYLVPADVAAWHAVMGDWLKAHDPYRHLVTTSCTGGSDRSELWSLPQMDYAMYHSYNLPDPVAGLPTKVASMRSRYRKPVMIGEYGVNWQGWNRAADDPALRGFRQGLWAGLLGGSLGTAMPWYWENIHSENLYWHWRNATNFLAASRLGEGAWEPVVFPAPPLPPATVGALRKNAAPFSARLALNGGWGAKPRGQMAVPHALAALESQGLLGAFVHGRAHPDLRTPFERNLWCGTNAALTLHLNSVSTAPRLVVMANRAVVFSRDLVNLDGKWDVNNEYNTNFVVALTPGLKTIQITNTGDDWFFLDWVEVTNVLTAEYASGWTSPPVACGVRGPAESLFYVASPFLRYPTRAPTSAVERVSGLSLTISNWPSGKFAAQWFDPLSGAWVARTRGVAAGGVLALPLPELGDDLAGRVTREPVMSAWREPVGVGLRVEAEAPLTSRLESSTNLHTWAAESDVTNVLGAGEWRFEASGGRRFYRSLTR